MVLTTGGDRRLFRAVSTGTAGAAVEFYDVVLYGAAAATVFGPVFFPRADGLLGVLLALSTYAVGFAARPLGGLVLGRWADRAGRKPALVLSLLLMGTASALIGVLPGHAAIGALAPLLLTLLRLVQGFALGGEFSGAVLVAEHSPPRSRGYWAAWPRIGAPVGNLLAAAAIATTAAATGAQYSTWGWRIPFLMSVLLVLLGLWARWRVVESPQFDSAPARRPGRPLRRALVGEFRAVFVVFTARLGESAAFAVFAVFLLVFAESVGVGPGTAIGAVAFGSVVQALSMLAGGALSDRIGRRPVAVLAALGCGVWASVFFDLVASGHPRRIVAAVTVGLLLHGLLAGAQSAFYAELFDTEVRCSGVSLGYQAATALGGAAAPLVGTYLLRASGSPVPVVVALLACLLVTVAGTAMSAETSRGDLRRASMVP